MSQIGDGARTTTRPLDTEWPLFICNHLGRVWVSWHFCLENNGQNRPIFVTHPYWRLDDNNTPCALLCRKVTNRNYDNNNHYSLFVVHFLQNVSIISPIFLLTLSSPSNNKTPASINYVRDKMFWLNRDYCQYLCSVCISLFIFHYSAEFCGKLGKIKAPQQKVSLSWVVGQSRVFIQLCTP